MRIGFDAKRFFQNATGLGNYARSVLGGLVEYFPEHAYTLYAPPPTQLPTFASGATVRIPGPWGRTFPTLWRSFGIPKTAASDHLNIYHGLSHELPLRAFAPGVRTVVTVHDLLFLTHPHLYPWLDRHIYTLKYKKSCQRADMVVTVSQKTAEDVQTIFNLPPERVRVAYQSCDPAFGRLLSAAQKRKLRRHYGLPEEFILFVGSLIPRKGVHTLFRALECLPAASRTPLVIVGQGWLEGALRAQAQKSKRTSQVHFLGRVPLADLPGIYQLARVFAYPSQAEGFGIPLVEAQISGLPAVTSTGSCFAETAGPAALYTTPGDADELAQALERLLTNSTLRQNMIQSGHEHAKRFHRRQTSTRLMDIYQELAGQP